MHLTPARRTTLVRVAAFLFVLAISILAFVYRDQIRQFARFGYLGAFLLPLIANATVFVPIPGVMVIFAMGSLFNPFLIAVLGGLGAATGELTGYLVGFSGRGLAEKVKYYDDIVIWMGKNPSYSYLLITVMAVIPNPFFDAAGIAAGTLKMPVWNFYIFCALGSIIKMLAFAYAGSLGIKWLLGP